MIKVLSIAGSDPSGGAGIQVDLKTFQMLRAYGMAIPAALTAQSSKGVAGVYPAAPARCRNRSKRFFPTSGPMP